MHNQQIAILALLILTHPLDDRIDAKLSGGVVSTKSMSIWELYQYKDTQMLRRRPLCYAPWLSYVGVNEYVRIESRYNRNCIVIEPRLLRSVQADARYNKRFAKRFKVKGSTRRQVRKIWDWLRWTQYVPHCKTAKSVFQNRQGDCMGVSSAFYVLCKVKKIPVRMVIGWDGNECHAWNRVKIRGKWYWIDCTMGLWISREQYEGRSVMEMW